MVKQIEQISTNYLYSVSTNCINNAIIISLNNALNYTDIVKIEKNNNGDIVCISTDTYKINSIGKNICKETTALLNNEIKKGIPIPFFAFLGIDLLSGYGSTVYFKMVNVQSVISTFYDNFSGVGINQTMHSLYINIDCKLFIDMPLSHTENLISVPVLICESVLMGKVPEVYLNNSK